MFLNIKSLKIGKSQCEQVQLISVVRLRDQLLELIKRKRVTKQVRNQKKRRKMLFESHMKSLKRKLSNQNP